MQPHAFGASPAGEANHDQMLDNGGAISGMTTVATV